MASTAKNSNWLGYGLYVVLVALLLLYFLFPAEAVEELAGKSVSRLNPQLGFRADKIKPWVPAGAMITNGEVFLREPGGSAVFAADTIYIGPRILDLFKGDLSLELDGKAYSGSLNGSIDFTGEERQHYSGQVNFRQFDLARYDFLVEKFKHTLTGKLSGELEFDNETAGSKGRNGKVKLRLTSGELRFREPVLNIISVDIQNIEMEAELRTRQITIARAELSGSEMNGSMTGTIQLQKDIGLSQLNLKGTLEPLAEFYKNNPEIRELLKNMNKRVRRGQYLFSITGTLGEPKFRLL